MISQGDFQKVDGIMHKELIHSQAIFARQLRLGTSPEKTSPARKCSVPGAEFTYSTSENNTRYFVLRHFT